MFDFYKVKRNPRTVSYFAEQLFEALLMQT